jgi:hypothetical protein
VSFVAVMQATDFWNRDDFASPHDGPRLGSILG